MSEVIKVGMADLNVCKAPDVITTLGLGSCIGLVLEISGIGGADRHQTVERSHGMEKISLRWELRIARFLDICHRILGIVHDLC